MPCLVDAPDPVLPLFSFVLKNRLIQKLSDTLCLPNIVNLNARRKTGFDENDAIDWNEKNASSVLQVRIFFYMKPLSS
jgi:predicted glycosyltransferase